MLHVMCCHCSTKMDTLVRSMPPIAGRGERAQSMALHAAIETGIANREAAHSKLRISIDVANGMHAIEMRRLQKQLINKK